jgi:hypothetical protein
MKGVNFQLHCIFFLIVDVEAQAAAAAACSKEQWKEEEVQR